MAEALQAIRRKIDSVAQLGAIVQTMKALAAAGIRQYERAAGAVEVHAETLELGFQAFLRAHPVVGPGPERPEGRRLAAVVIGSEQGMCGAFNERLAGFAVERLRPERGDPPPPVLVVGERAAERLRNMGALAQETLPAATSLAGVTPLIERILSRVDGWLAGDRFDRLVVFHNRRLTGTAYRPRLVHLYPLPQHWFRELEGRRWPQRGLPTFTMDWRPLLSALTHEFLFVSLFRALVESLESENASRLGAMEAAERNVEELLGELQSDFRRERQDSMMAELLDILAGYEAAEGEAIERRR